MGNGSYAALDKSVVNVGTVNGTTRMLVINGTLPNGTDTEGEDEEGGASSWGSRQSMVHISGFWVVGGIVGAMIWLL